ncbi:MAG: TAXI family TRAP transporter solute-binding subunit [Proteobacteria bacterium]|nr:TAXI family TRAP transporter solute-binding subunit [Pseudomonadota bacterium]
MAPLVISPTRRQVLGLLAGGALSPLLGPGPARAQDMMFFRIGTGGAAGTYYPVGALIANIISNPPGSRPCDKGGSCGVPGLVAVAQSSEGSVSNVEDVNGGFIESAFCQSDIVFSAYHAYGLFEGRKPLTNVRLIANLYPETVQILVAADSSIARIEDLKGRRISLDAEGSGTLVDARIILGHFGLADDNMAVEYLQAGPAAARMREGTLDAFFVIAGTPTASVADLIAGGVARLLPIPDVRAIELMVAYPFFSLAVVPEGTYPGAPAVSTLSVGAQWIVSPMLEDDLVYGITSALWNENSRKLLDSGHPAARQIKLSNALQGAAIPLHAGARRYYEEIGFDLSTVALPAETPPIPGAAPAAPAEDAEQ